MQGRKKGSTRNKEGASYVIEVKQKRLRERVHETFQNTHREGNGKHPEKQKKYRPNWKTNKSECGEGCMSRPKAHTEEPRRHIQNVKIYISYLENKQK